MSSGQLVLRAAVAAYLGRYRGQTRVHTDSDLRIFLRWCDEQDLEPLVAVRTDIERYVRWLQDIHGFSPRRSPGGCRSWSGSTASASSTASCCTRQPTTFAGRLSQPSRRRSAWVILQFEGLISTARLSTNPNDFALVALLGMLGLRIFEVCGASISDLGEEHGHRVLRVRGKGGKVVVLMPLPPAVGRAIDWAVDDRDDGPILRNTLGVRMDRHAATRRRKHLAATAGIRMPSLRL